MAFKPKIYEVKIDKLVHGGQGIGTLEDGKKALVWNVLPGEKVRFHTIKGKKSFVDGIADEILEASAEREEPRDKHYLSSSPWQMMSYTAENKYKPEILQETLQRAGVKFANAVGFFAPKDPWHYRNKMEYAFFGDEAGLHLASYTRGSHRKQIVKGSSLAKPELDAMAAKVLNVLDAEKVRASDLKTMIVRCNANGECVAALFVRDTEFSELEKLAEAGKGVVVYYSDPRSPASVPTKKLQTYGDITLKDEILGKPIIYDVLSFFQVNLRTYEEALKVIRDEISGKEVTDMYAGVGSIGLAVAQNVLRMVEADPHSVAMARENISGENREIEIIETPSEKALDYIPSGVGKAVIFDPPRAGLHQKVTQAVIENGPEQIVYLSCNSSTFGRDLELLQSKYEINKITGYNFFPRTPHIEALAILTRKK